MNKQHIGDFVYANINKHNQLVLTAEYEGRIDQHIYIEPEVWKALLQYAADNWAFAKRLRDEEIYRAIQESQKVRPKHIPRK